MFDIIVNSLQKHVDLGDGLRQIRSKASGISRTGNGDVELPNSFEIDAGAGILNHFHSVWNRVHSETDLNSQHAIGSSQELSKLYHDVRQRVLSVAAFQNELRSLPKIADDISSMIANIAQLEGLCEEVESTLAYLDIIGKVEALSELKLDQRFQLAVHREKKLQELEAKKSELSLEYVERVENLAQRKKLEREEKRQALQEAFDSDLQNYRQFGIVSNALHDPLEPLEFPKFTSVAEQSCSSRLSDVEIEDENADDFEDFLSGTDSKAKTEKNEFPQQDSSRS